MTETRIWKISHGNLEFNSQKELRDFLADNHYVTMCRATGKGQGRAFEFDMRIGDYFFLREKGRIKLFGRIESDAEIAPDEVNDYFGYESDDDMWLVRKYSVVLYPILNEKYSGNQRRWTPNHNTTLGLVPPDQLGEFEEWIFKPYFGKDLSFFNNHNNDPAHTSQEDTMSNMHPLNTILYGPPGTGKTFNTVNYAVAIVEGKNVSDIIAEKYDEVHKRFDIYRQQGRIAFTTFHQSYDYEDFIEGIRPNTDMLRNGNSENIQYIITDGVFRKFCDKAEDNRQASRKTQAEISAEERAKHSIDELLEEELSKEEKDRRRFRTFNGNEFFLKDAKEKIITVYLPDNPSWKDVPLSRAELVKIIASNQKFEKPKEVHNFLGKGAPRAHDSYLFALNQAIHQQKSTIQSPVEAVSLQPYIFIIDEINRGNISKIFGELITLIEPDKRLGAKEETKAILPYSGEEFGVPPNVYILGTMNTADRSIALIDTALRRRFNFVEMMPKPGLLKEITVEDTGIDLAKMLQTMNDRIEFLLDREHTIGHAYFMGDFEENPTLAGLADIFRCRIIPLLQEYFFDDYAKIRLVLGDNNKPSAAQFFTEKTSDGVFFGNVEDSVDLERKIYCLNDAAFGNPDAYRMIYPSAAQR